MLKPINRHLPVHFLNKDAPENLFHTLSYRKIDDTPIYSLAYVKEFRGELYLWCINRHVVVGTNLAQAFKYNKEDYLDFFYDGGVYEVVFERYTNRVFTTDRRDGSRALRFFEWDKYRTEWSVNDENIRKVFKYIKTAIKVTESDDFFTTRDLRSDYVIQALAHSKCPLVNTALLGPSNKVWVDAYRVYPRQEYTVFATENFISYEEKPELVYLVRRYENGRDNAENALNWLGYTMPTTTKKEEKKACQKSKTKK